MINDVAGKQERKRTIYFCLLAVWDKSDVISSLSWIFSVTSQAVTHISLRCSSWFHKNSFGIFYNLQ